MRIINELLIRYRYFRRRSKTSLLFAIVLIVFFFFILSSSSSEGSNLGSIGENGEGGVKNPDENNGPFAFISNKLSALAGLILPEAKTTPFYETPAGTSEFNKDLNNPINLKKLELASKDDVLDDNWDNAFEFFEKVFHILHDAKPGIDSLNTYPSDERIYHARFDASVQNDPVFSEKYLSSFLQLSPEELNAMKKSHDYVIEKLPEEAPEGIYSGDGIVYVGGGKFNWLVLLSIRYIRDAGSILPIEVMIPNIYEYESSLCQKVLPELEAKCVYMNRRLMKNTNKSIIKKFDFEGYQYKALAILSSSFENVLLLDSDNIPVRSPDHLFKEDPFISKGIVVWPDFWRRATSPDYYKISGSSISDTELLPKYNEKEYVPNLDNLREKGLDDIPLHERAGSIPDPTSESGQLMISKKTHLKALLLALYYNIYGPSHYYPLFSQGSDGEGDKETFLAATCALNKEFYQVGRFLTAIGYFNIENQFVGTAMAQYDPVEDYRYAQSAKDKSNSNAEESAPDPTILFLHANHPKLDPWMLHQEKLIYDENQSRIRMYGTSLKARTGNDLELKQWSNMNDYLCKQKLRFSIFEKVDRTELCKVIGKQLAFLTYSRDTLE